MSDRQDLVPRPESSPVQNRAGARSVLSGMVDDALATHHSAAARRPQLHRIGGHELRTPHYEQVCLCADELSVAPNEALQRIYAKIEDGFLNEVRLPKGLSGISHLLKGLASLYVMSHQITKLDLSA